MAERFKKIRMLVQNVIEPSVEHIKKTRKRTSMPYKDIGKMLKIFFPRTKHLPTGRGAYKCVFIIHSEKRNLALKIGRKNKDIGKDHTTYKNLSPGIQNRYFAKIYWRHHLFLLQKCGKKVKVPRQVLEKLKLIGKQHGLKDVREANIMKFGNGFKIVDAERI